MKLLLAVASAIVLLQSASAHKLTSRVVKPFTYWKDKADCPDVDRFPITPCGINRYESRYPEVPSADDLFKNIDNTTEQAQRAYEWRDFMDPPRVLEIIPGKVYQAVYFALGFPTIWITPEDTLIWIDAPESATAANEVIEAFRAVPAIRNKPIVALIYTMFHADHIWGAGPIVNDVNNVETPVIIAHSRLLPEAYFHDTYKGFKTPRINRMFGVKVPDPPYIHSGGVYRLRLEGPYVILYPPTDTLYFETPDVIVTREIGGLEIQFISVPGYTSDQIIVYNEDYSILQGADVFYQAHPNLYTLRGEPGRDPRKWAEGTRRAAALNADFSTFTHSAGLIGADLIRETLLTYADGIQYLHDQTVRYMTKGFPPDIIPEVVNMPRSLAELPMFEQSYGIEDTAIKGIFDYYVGWFSGLTEDLFPVNRFERGAKLIELVGRTRMQSAAARAYNQKEYEWALELSTYLWRNNDTDRFAMEIRTESMKRLAEVQVSMASRNYYTHVVLEDWDVISNVIDTDTAFVTLHLDGAMKNLQFHLNNEVVEDVNEILYVNLFDIDTIFKLEIRNSIMDYDPVDAPGSDAPTLNVQDTCGEGEVFCWRYLLGGFFPWVAIPAEAVTNGTPEDIVNYFLYFDFQDEIDNRN